MRGRLRAAVTFIIVALLAWGGVWTTMSPSRAAAGGGVAYTGEGDSGWSFIGSYKMADGTIAWCAFDRTLAGVDWKPNATWGDWQTVDSITASTGTVISGENARRYAYLMWKYGETTDTDTAMTLYRVLHEQSGVGFGANNDVRTAGYSPRAAELWDEAGRQAGPYAGPAAPDYSLVAGGTAADVVLHPVIAASGQPLASDLTAHIDGPAVWADNGGADLVFNGGSGDVSKQIRATGNGTVTVSVAGEVADTRFMVAEPNDPTAQSVMAAGKGSSVRAQRDAIPVVFDFQPIATSTAKTWTEVTVDGDGPRVGDTLPDVIHAVANDESPWIRDAASDIWTRVDYKVTWYYSETQRAASDAAPADVSVFDTVTVRADNGPGDYTATTTKAADKPGFYYPVISVTKAAQPEPDKIKADWSAKFHDDNEESLVPWSPKVTTKTSDTRVESGTEITDTLQVSGNNPNQTLNITSTLYGPYLTRPSVLDVDNQSADGPVVPEGSKTVCTVNTDVKGNGEFETPSCKVSDKGYYVWVESIPATDTTFPWRGDFGEHDETTIVPWSVRYSSVISERSAAIESSVFDTINAAGLPAHYGEAVDGKGNPGDWDDTFKLEAPDNEANADGSYNLPDGYGAKSTLDITTATVTLYGPLAAEPQRSSQIPSDAKVFSKVELPVVNGQVVGNPFPDAFAEDGYYTAVISVAAGDRVDAYTSDFGIPSETVKVGTPATPEQPKQPNVSTLASDDVELGQPVHDTAQVVDEDKQIDTVKFDLYKVSDKTGDLQKVCTTETKVWSSATPVKVDGTGDYASEEFTPTEPGTYTYVETALDKDGNELHKGECGVSEETVSVHGTPVIPVTPQQPTLARTGAEDAWPLVAGAAAAVLIGSLAALARHVIAKRSERRSGKTEQAGQQV